MGTGTHSIDIHAAYKILPGSLHDLIARAKMNERLRNAFTGQMHMTKYPFTLYRVTYFHLSPSVSPSTTEFRIFVLYANTCIYNCSCAVILEYYPLAEPEWTHRIYSLQIVACVWWQQLQWWIQNGSKKLWEQNVVTLEWKQSKKHEYLALITYISICKLTIAQVKLCSYTHLNPFSHILLFACSVFTVLLFNSIPLLLFSSFSSPIMYSEFVVEDWFPLPHMQYN